VNYRWTCGCCGKQFDSLPLDWACKAPDHWFQISEEERAKGKLDSDVCRIDGVGIFVRGCLEIPIQGTGEKFIYGVWVSVSQESFERIVELWTAEDVGDEPPFFGWLCNQVPGYPPTLELKTNLHLRSNNLRPSIELEPTDHPLAVEQREGTTMARVEEFVASQIIH